MVKESCGINCSKYSCTDIIHFRGSLGEVHKICIAICHHDIAVQEEQREITLNEFSI